MMRVKCRALKIENLFHIIKNFGVCYEMRITDWAENRLKDVGKVV